MRKIRVLHIVQAAGGVDRFLRSLIKNLDKNKFENILICSNDFTFDNYKDDVSEFYQLDMKRNVSFRDLVFIFKVRKLIKQIKPDIVYAHSSKAGVIARIADIWLDNKIIYNPHGWAFNMRGSRYKRLFYAFIEKVCSFFCDKIVCVSDSEKMSALRWHICKANKVKVIYNGIDIDDYKNRKYSSSKFDLGIPENAFVVGMVGRIAEQKAPDIFVKVAEIVKQRIQNAFFVIVGDGPLLNKIKDQIHNSNLDDSFLITGWCSDPLEYSRFFDVSCLFSRWEAFGLVLAEYMMVKSPIVATNVDAIPNLIKNNENGLLICEDDYREASEAICKLHDNASLVKQLTDHAYSFLLKRFDIKLVIKNHEDLFRDLLSYPKF